MLYLVSNMQTMASDDSHAGNQACFSRWSRRFDNESHNGVGLIRRADKNVGTDVARPVKPIFESDTNVRYIAEINRIVGW